MRTKRQHSRNMGYGGVTNGTLRSKNQLLQEQPHAHRAAGFCCWGAGLLLGGRTVAWCSVQKEGNVRVPFSIKTGLYPILTCVHGERGCRSPIPGDVAETGGFALPVPKAKKFKRLATRDTLHGSRPNPQVT